MMNDQTPSNPFTESIPIPPPLPNKPPIHKRKISGIPMWGWIMIVFVCGVQIWVLNIAAKNNHEQPKTKQMPKMKMSEKTERYIYRKLTNANNELDDNTEYVALTLEIALIEESIKEAKSENKNHLVQQLQEGLKRKQLDRQMVIYDVYKSHIPKQYLSQPRLLERIGNKGKANNWTAKP